MMNATERKLMAGILDEAGRDLWDKCVELCAKAAETVPVSDRNPAHVRNKIADRIRQLAFSVTPDGSAQYESEEKP